MPSIRRVVHLIIILAILVASGRRAFALEPRINEFVADNQHGLSDQDGDEVDWVEIYNPNPVPLDLTGWYLTDDLAQPAKWQFPSTTINGNGFILVFASGKDRKPPGGELHTNFNLKASGESIALVKPDGVTVASQFVFGPQQADVSFGPAAVTSNTETLIGPDSPARAFIPASNALGTTWTTPGFDDSSWSSGTLAAGYESGSGYQALLGLDVRPAMNGVRTSCYIRIPFTISNLNDALGLLLRIRYDDGFAVYLNGTLLPAAGRNAPSTLSFDSPAAAEHDDAEAVQYEDIDITQHIGLLNPGQNILAIHGLNISLSSSDFLIGPQLLLTRGTYSNGFMTTPTPGAPNASGVQGFVSDTSFSVDRGFYSAPFDVQITCATPGAAIRYTRNGDAPTATTGFVYTGPISITATTTLRAAAYKDGFQPSNVDTHTYLFLDDVILQSSNGAPPPGWPSGTVNGQEFDYGMDPNVVSSRQATIKSSLQAIPSISLVTNLPNLLDPSTGIYVNSSEHGEEWERPVSVEILNDPLNPGPHGFQVNGGIRIRGGFSRSGSNPKHSLRLFFREAYGAGKMKYHLFGDRGATSFDGFDLRTSQDASWAYLGSSENTFLRDEAARETQVALGYGSRCRYFHLYLNGQYWGLYDTDERPNKSFGAQYFGGDKDNYDVIKSSGASGGYQTEASDGTMAVGSAWHQLWSGARAVRSSPTNANYFKLTGRAADGVTPTTDPVVLDPAGLADYMLTLFYMGGNDGPVSEYVGASNNWFGMRLRGGNTGFRFFIHDFEQSLGLESTTNQRVGKGSNIAPWSNSVSGANDINRSNPEFLHEDLAANLEYRVVFGDRAHRHLFNGGAMTDANVLSRMNNLAAMIDTAIWGESARWGDAQREPPLTRDDWLNANSRLFNFITRGNTGSSGPGRAATLITQLRGYDSGSKPLYPLLNAPVFSQHGGSFPPAGTTVSITHSNTGITNLYYTVSGPDPRVVGGGVNPAAIIYSGPIPLGGWTTTLRSRVKKGADWSALNEAVFSRSGPPPPIRITELMITPMAPTASEASAGYTDKDNFEFVELLNAGTESVNLRNIRFSQGLTFVFDDDVTLAAGERAVIVRNRAAFQLRYGSSIRILGEYLGSLDDSGEQLTLISALGDTIVDFTYDNKAPWPEDLTGQSLVLRGPALNPANPANWRPSSGIGGNPATVDSSNFQSWKSAYGVTDNLEDVDHDGLLPLIEYATGGLPTSPDWDRTPQVQITFDPAAPADRYILVSITRQRETDDLVMDIEQSTNLADWASATIHLDSSVAEPDGTDRQVWRILPAIDSSASTFLRVRWTQVP